MMNGSKTVRPLENDYDLDEDPIEVKILGSIEPSEGSIVLNPDNSVTFTPATGFIGTVDVSYRMGNVEGSLTDEATIHFSVLEKNVANELKDHSVTTAFNTPIQFPILTNPPYPAGIQEVMLSPAQYGVASLTVDNKVSYSPNAGFVGDDVFTYTVKDNLGNLESATITVTVEPAMTHTITPTIEDETDKDVPVTIDTLSFLEEEIEFGPVVTANFSSPVFGTIDFQANGNIIYDPGNQNRGIVTFSFSLYDAMGVEVNGNIEISVDLLSTEIAIYLYPFTTINPYNQEEHESFFIQQGDTIDLKQHLDYGLVGNNYPANDVTSEKVEIFMISDKGYVAPGESLIVGENGTILYENVLSYGQVMLVYNAGDDLNHTGQSVPRLLTINHQPQVSTGPITPDDPFYMAIAPSYHEDVFYHDMTFNLLDYVYLYDFEDYDVNPGSPVVTVPLGMDINFIVDNQEYDLSQIWDVLKVPADEEPDITEKIFDIQFKAYDSDGGESELSEVFRLKVKNNPPYFKYDGQEKENGAVLPMAEDLYTTVGVSINLWEDVTAHDLEKDTDGLPIITSLEWRLGSGGYSSDPFPYTAGYYDLKYIVEDAHGQTAELFRNIEVNTVPTIENQGDNPLIRQVGDSLNEWQDIVWQDLDPEDAGDMLEAFTPTKQWNFDTDMWDDYSGTIDTSVHGRYMMQYKITDPWDEYDQVMRELWVNQAPWITLEDSLVLLEERSPEDDEIFTAMDGVTYGDLEDNYLELEDSPVLDYTINVWAMEMDEAGTYPPSTVEIIDTTRSGVYMIQYTVEDSMGGTYMTTRMVMISEAPMVNLDPSSLSIETGGMFPVWNGLEVEFWSPDNLVEPDAGPSLPHAEFSFRAYLGDPSENEELFDLYQFEEPGSYDINYVATVRVEDYDVLYPVQVQEYEPMYFMSETVAKRDVEVTSQGMGEVVYFSDFLPFGMFMGRNSLEEQIQEEPNDGWVSLYDEYDIYPVLMKYNPDTNEERIVTAIAFDTIQSQGREGVRFDPNFGFDDIAVLNNGEIYGLIFNDVWLIEEDGNLDYVFNIYDELEHRLGSGIYQELEDFNFQAMTADAEDNLVIPTPLNMLQDADDQQELEPEILLLYFDPNKEMDEEVVDTSSAHEGPYYWIGVGIVNYPYQHSMGPFDSITDIAYSSDFQMLYGIGGHYEDPYYEGPVKGDLSVESLNSIRTENYYRLFSLVEVEMPEEEILPSDIDDDFFMKYFDVNSQQNLLEGFRYKGIASLDEDIFVTRYNSPGLAMDLDMIGLDEAYFQTDVLRYKFGSVNFEFQEDLDPIDGMFMGALGAGSTFQKSWMIMPAVENLFVGFNTTSADGIANFQVEFLPQAAFEDDVVWTIVSGETYITNDGDGQFTAIPDNIGGSASATISAEMIEKSTGEPRTVVGTINITRLNPPPPTPTPAPTPVIGVTLDIDAITLDYGPTADPEFTSYDFTETVTGTTDTRVTWELDDDTFVTVDENGVVQAREDIPADTGDITVELTVRTVVGNATDTATIIFEEQTPLGAIEFFDPYVVGYPDGSFKPKNNVSRAEVAAMFARFLRLNVDFPGSQKFVDVPPSHWAYPYIQAMYRTGIFKGYVNDQGQRMFEPNAPIKRAEIAQVFTNYWDYLDISVTSEAVASIPDVPTNHWAFSAINRVYNTGMFNGFADGSFEPENPTLREQLVSMINIMLNRPKNEPETSKFNDIQPDHPYFGDIEAASQTFLNPQGE